MNQKICLLTGKNNFFGQTRKPWVSINTPLFIDYLQQLNVDVEVHNFDDIANLEKAPSNSIVFYTFSQKEELRLYLKSVVHYLHNLNNVVIPNYDLLLCHENKGYQELYKKKLGIVSLKAFFFSDIDFIKSYHIKYPVVLKTVYGSNGKGVFLIKNEDMLRKYIRRLKKIVSIYVKLDLLRRRYLRKAKSYKGYPNYSNKTDFYQYNEYVKPEIRFVIQEFVPNLEFDYRITILWDKYYVIKRLNKDKDFRASGAKNFVTITETPTALLNFSRELFNRFDTPFLSIDIGESEGRFYLFEFQALHFGINSIVLSDGYYKQKNNCWNFVEKKVQFEKSLAEGLVNYLNDRFPKQDLSSSALKTATNN